MMDWLIDCALKSTALLLLALVCTTLVMRRSSAARRHLVWVIAVSGALAMPILRLALPEWQTLPKWTAREQVTAATAQPIISHTPIAQPAAQRIVTPARSIPANPEVPSLATDRPAQRSDSSPLPLLQWIDLYWVGVILLCLPLLAGVISLYRLRRMSTVASDTHWQDLLSQLKVHLRINRPVRLLKSPCRAMPMTWGILPGRPATILIPEEADEWLVDRQRAVLLHELAHIKRHDCRTQLLAQLARALHWYNPLIWYAHRRMTIERERACDDLVLQHGHYGEAYAQHIFEIAAGPGASRFSMATGIPMARQSHLSQRLRAILDGGQNRRTVTKFVLLLTVLISLAIVLPVAAMREKEMSTELQDHAAPARPTHGKVIDGKGNPVAGAALNDQLSNWTATTDANGEFRLPYGEGNWSFDITAEGYTTGSYQYSNRTPGSFPSLATFEIHRYGTIRGRIIDGNGKPLKRIVLYANSAAFYPPHYSSFTAFSRGAVTNEEGDFELTQAIPGDLVLSFTHDTPDARKLVGMRHVKVGDGETVNNVVFDLRESTHSIEGAVVDADGNPLPNARVNLTFSLKERGQMGANVPNLWPAKCDANGRYRVDHLPAGEWQIRGSHGQASGEAIPINFAQGSVPNLVVPVRRTPDGFIRRLPEELSGKDVVIEWINATKEGDTRSADALVLKDSPFALHASTYRDLLTQFGENDFSGWGDRFDHEFALTNTVNAPDGSQSKLQFELQRTPGGLKLQSVTLEDGSPLFGSENPNPLKLSLASGATIELYGVADSPLTDNSPWWKPDGSPLENPPQRWNVNQVSGLKGPHAYEVAVRFNHHGSKELIGLWWKFETTEDLPIANHSAPGIQSAAVGSRTPLQTVDAQLGVASGPWTTIYESDGSLNGDIRSGNLHPISPTSESWMLMEPEQSERAQLRVIAIDKAGTVHIPRRTTGMNRRWSTMFDFPPSEIRAIQVQSRPWEWFELRNISLEPGHTTQPEISPIEMEAAPNDPVKFWRFDEALATRE